MKTHNKKKKKKKKKYRNSYADKPEPIKAGNLGIKFVLVKLVGSRFVVS
jgi:hypothetical protein